MARFEFADGTEWVGSVDGATWTVDGAGVFIDNTPTVVSGGYRYLQGILDERRDELDTLADPPTACPNDGEPLDVAPDGSLRCRFDGYTWAG